MSARESRKREPQITTISTITAASAFAGDAPSNIDDYWMPQQIKLKATALYSDYDDLIEKGDDDKGSEQLKTTKVSVTEKKQKWGHVVMFIISS